MTLEAEPGHIFSEELRRDAEHRSTIVGNGCQAIDMVYKIVAADHCSVVGPVMDKNAKDRHKARGMGNRPKGCSHNLLWINLPSQAMHQTDSPPIKISAT